MTYEAKDKFQTYAAFWPFYLSRHAKRSTRRIHVLGTLLALLLFVIAVFSLSLLWLLAALAAGYGFAWLSHVTTEKNRPATFARPLWSLRGDFHMLWFWLTGRLEAELVRNHILT